MFVVGAKRPNTASIGHAAVRMRARRRRRPSRTDRTDPNWGCLFGLRLALQRSRYNVDRSSAS